MISKHEIEAAYMRVKRFAVKTPLLTNDRLNEYFDAEVWLKCEQFQPIGAFKIRGASNYGLQLTKEELKQGLVTHSSGNHAQAVAYVGHHLGSKAYIVMPENSNKVKIANAKRWGAEVHLCEPTIEARSAMAEEIQKETGAILMNPYDHDWIIAGQASCAMEIYREQQGIDMLIAPLGGGGLLSGSALATKYVSPDTEVIGTEPTEASDGFEGFHSGKRVETIRTNTVADGLRTTVGKQPFEIIKAHVHDIWLAEEKAIIDWMYQMWDWTKLILEPSCAVPFAAMDQQRHKIKGKKVAVVITGGNVDFNSLPARVA